MTDSSEKYRSAKPIQCWKLLQKISSMARLIPVSILPAKLRQNCYKHVASQQTASDQTSEEGFEGSESNYWAKESQWQGLFPPINLAAQRLSALIKFAELLLVTFPFSHHSHRLRSTFPFPQSLRF